MISPASTASDVRLTYLFFTLYHSRPKLPHGQFLHADLVLGIGPAFNLYPLNHGVALVVQAVQESACNAEDLGLIPGSGRLPGEGNGNLLQYSHLGNPMDREAWRATFYEVTELDMT